MSINNIEAEDYNVFLPVRIDNVRIRAMLDSGNVFRVCMSKRLADELGIQASQLRPMPGYTTIDTAAEGAQLKVLGETKRKVSLNFGANTKSITCRPVVLDKLSMDLNISGPFMRRHGIDLLQSKGVARIQGQELPLVGRNEEASVTKGTYSMVYTAENTRLHSREAQWIPAVAPTVANGDMVTDHLLVTGDGEFTERYDVHPMVSSIVRVNNHGQLSVLAMNTTNHDIHIKAGSLYGAGFCTTSPDRMYQERDKICVIDPTANRGLYKKEDVEKKTATEKASPTDIVPNLNEAVQQMMDGERPLPRFMKGPTTRMNRAKRVGFLLEFFKLRNNPVLKEKKDLDSAVEVLLRFWDIFAFDGNYGHTDLVQHNIEVEPGTVPIYEKYRPPNPLLEESMKKQLQLWLKHGVIVESNSPWNFNLLAAVKK